MQIKINGMMCKHCVARVTDALKAAGATDIVVDLENGTAKFTAGSVAAKVYKTAVEDVGYDVTEVIL